jgi:hypothetical protein
MTLYKGATFKPVVNHGGNMKEQWGLVVHVQVGDNSLYEWFNNPVAEVSAHFWVSKLGPVEQYVPADTVAWAEMAGNDFYCSVETEGLPTEPLTKEQINSLALLMAWGRDTLGWKLELVDHGSKGITTHAHYPSNIPDPAWGGHPCPGPIRAAQLPAIVAQAVKWVK